MARIKGSQQLVLRGEVIEVVEQLEEKVIKVSLFPCSIDLPVPPHDESHLGDTVSFEVSIRVNHVERVVPMV